MLDSKKEISNTSLAPSLHEPYIDFLRIIACFMVIVNHTNSSIFLNTTPCKTWFASLSWFFISKSAVPIFVMISGAVLLKKQDTPKKSFSRFARAFIVLLISSAIYYIYYGQADLRALSIVEFIKKILSSSSITTALWYMYLYLEILCVLPLLQKMAASFKKTEIGFLIFLTLGFQGTILLIQTLTAAQLKILSVYRLFSPYIGMIFAGYYIERHAKISRQDCFWAGVIYVLLIVFQVYVTYLLYQKNQDTASYLVLDQHTRPIITGGAICLYILAKYFFTVVHIPPRAIRLICQLGSLTFGIYLLGDMLIALMRPLYDHMLSACLHPFVAMILWEICIFLTGAVIIAVLRKIPLLRKWI